MERVEGVIGPGWTNNPRQKINYGLQLAKGRGIRYLGIFMYFNIVWEGKYSHRSYIIVLVG